MKRKSILAAAALLFAVSPMLCMPVFGDFIVGWGQTAFGALNVPPGGDFVAISAYNDAALALRSDGSLTAWGGLQG